MCVFWSFGGCCRLKIAERWLKISVPPKSASKFSTTLNSICKPLILFNAALSLKFKFKNQTHSWQLKILHWKANSRWKVKVPACQANLIVFEIDQLLSIKKMYSFSFNSNKLLSFSVSFVFLLRLRFCTCRLGRSQAKHIEHKLWSKDSSGC